jgi:site-specific recombinase XerD
VTEFANFVGIRDPEEFLQITRAHVIAWRDQLARAEASPATIRSKLAALSSLFQYLCDKNSVTHNPVKGVKRPSQGNNEGKTPAVSDEQARRLLKAPNPDTLKGKRDLAILATFLYHGPRREEICRLRECDLESRRGVIHFRIHGKRGKIRLVPVHSATIELIHEYLQAAGHQTDMTGPLFRPVKNSRGGLDRALDPQSLWKMVKRYATQVGIDPRGISPHGLRATAATNALDHAADIGQVQRWLGHANTSTTQLYDRRKMRAEDSPTFKVRY